MYFTALISKRTLCASGATTRARMRRSELTWGYSRPDWFVVAGLKSSTDPVTLGTGGLGAGGAGWARHTDADTTMVVNNDAVRLGFTIPSSGRCQQPLPAMAQAIPRISRSS